VLRYFFLQSHYRSKQNFTWEALKGAKHALDELREKSITWQGDKRTGENKGKHFKDQFIEAISDDINIPKSPWCCLGHDQSGYFRQ